MPGTSAAVKFDVYVPNPNGGTSFPQTGLYTNGQMDDNGVSVSPRVGINFPDGNVYRVELQYYPVPKLLTETIQNASKPGIGSSDWNGSRSARRSASTAGLMFIVALTFMPSAGTGAR